MLQYTYNNKDTENADTLDLSANEPKNPSIFPKPTHITNRKRIIELFTQRVTKNNK